MNDRKDNSTAATVADPFFEAALDQAIAEEITRLKREGYSKAAICERSHEIEADARRRLADECNLGPRKPL